jgi:hypothetical protein
VHSLKWSHPGSGKWWSFARISDSDAPRGLHGVYCVFQRLPGRYRTIWVGQGDIGERLAAHAREPRIFGRPFLLVTWAETDAAQTDGIQKFLIEALRPIEGEQAPDAEPTTVNLPYRV